MNALIASNRIVSAIHLQIRYDTVDEQVYCYSDRQTRFVLETNSFGARHAHVWQGGDEHFSDRDKGFNAGEEHVENAHSNFSHTRAQPAISNFQPELMLRSPVKI